MLKPDPYPRDANSTAKDWGNVTPSDTEDLKQVARMLRFGMAGDAVIVNGEGVAVTVIGIVAGEKIPGWATRVNATGTTAGNIVAFYR